MRAPVVRGMERGPIGCSCLTPAQRAAHQTTSTMRVRAAWARPGQLRVQPGPHGPSSKQRTRCPCTPSAPPQESPRQQDGCCAASGERRLGPARLPARLQQPAGESGRVFGPALAAKGHHVAEVRPARGRLAAQPLLLKVRARGLRLLLAPGARGPAEHVRAKPPEARRVLGRRLAADVAGDAAHEGALEALGKGEAREDIHDAHVRHVGPGDLLSLLRALPAEACVQRVHREGLQRERADNVAALRPRVTRGAAREAHDEAVVHKALPLQEGQVRGQVLVEPPQGPGLRGPQRAACGKEVAILEHSGRAPRALRVRRRSAAGGALEVQTRRDLKVPGEHVAHHHEEHLPAPTLQAVEAQVARQQ
mmetsp:Transcript_13910/g.47066  ORF Transcript_13910/g.47066 Transcript_13910/m.47066 type:complete len:365 (-) Transcript_13910:312-1406(-)